MRTFELHFKNNGDAHFINENDKKDKIHSFELMRFNTHWSGKNTDYKDCEGYFEGCNCFVIKSYSIDFYQLSECGEQLTDFNNL